MGGYGRRRNTAMNVTIAALLVDAIGVAWRGKTIYRRAFGLASVELGVANQPTTRFRVASTSKHFACLAVMLLAVRS